MYSGISYGLYCDFPSCRVSIDSIRLKFTYALKSFVWSRGSSILSIDKMSFIIDNLPLVGSDFDVQWSYKDFFKIGAYCRTARVSGYLPGTCEPWSFALMFGRYAYNSFVHFLEPEIVMDINPNKVPFSVISKFLLLLRDGVKSVRVVRFDIAFDFPVARDDVCFVRSSDGRRSYRLFLDDGAKTEYQGARGAHGALKIYDKTAESNLSVPVTRCEITVDGGKLSALESLFPRLYCFVGHQMDISFSSLPFPVRACLLHPDLLDDMLASVSLNTRKKYLALMDSLKGCLLTVPDWPAVVSFVHNALNTYTGVRL